MYTLKNLCTITTKSHLKPTQALGASAFSHCRDIAFHVLVTDMPKNHLPKDTSNSFYYSLADIETAYLGKEIIKKYAGTPDKLRWSLKSVFMHFLLLQKDVQRLIYADNDIFFFKDFTFLFDALNEHNILLCQHWRCNHPRKSKEWFLVNFTDGFYNAGFIGANKQGAAMLEWWADACCFKCAKVSRKGLFDDQKYLDFVPLLFEKVDVLKHRGCNVAYWNQTENKRSYNGEEVMINGNWPVIFIHFTKKLIKSIKSGKDPLLEDFLVKYLETLNTF